MGREAERKKIHHRVNMDRQVWEQITRGSGGEMNFSRLVSSLLESYVGRMSTTASRTGQKVSVDITVDDALWSEASRLARAHGLSLSHVLRELLQEHLREVRKRKPS